MRQSLRCLNAIASRVAMRGKSTSFIGLGRMGSEMAFNLFSKQHALAPESHYVVCDAVPEASHSFASKFLSQFPAAKIAIASSPEEAVIASSQIITMLPSSPQVLSVYCGERGILPALTRVPRELAESTLCIDSTTLDVAVAREVAASVIKTGAQMIDAPVSGGTTGAKAATLSFLVGGTKAAFEEAEPILKCMGSRVIHVGTAGAGLGAKICNNMVLGVQQIVVGEAMLLGQKLGLDISILASVINSSTGNCWSCNTNNPVAGALKDKLPPCERDYEGGFATSLMLKDMGLATDIAALSKSPVPMAAAAHKVYEESIGQVPDLAGKDFSSVYKWLQTPGAQAYVKEN